MYNNILNFSFLEYKIVYTTLLQLIVLIFIASLFSSGEKIFRRSKHLQDGPYHFIFADAAKIWQFRGYNADYYFDIAAVPSMKSRTVTPPRYQSPSIIEAKPGTTRVSGRSVWSVD